ncbi:hypothetical protein HK104_006126 [Borealophlyctis nickersoniae]|nr:hypothetical protein HK104_006126 [Borealophlyctis nickersoniae]
MPKSILVKQAGSVNEHVFIDDIPKPVPQQGQLLVKVRAAAFNPADMYVTKTGFQVESWPTTLGYDFSGTVVEVASGVQGFSAGDEVWGTAKGSFAEYIVAPADRVYKKSSNLSFEEAATLGVGISTTVSSLFTQKGLNLARPSANQSFFRPEWVLILGGAGSMGSYAVQLAAAAGYSVIATASKKNFDYVQTLGAVHVVDYTEGRDAQISKIKELTGGRIQYAFDTVGGEAQEVASAVLSNNPKATLISIAVGKRGKIRDGLTFRETFGYDPDVNAFVREMTEEEIVPYFAQGRIKPNMVKVVEGGLEGVKQGLASLAEGTVSGFKLVISV